MTKDLWAFSLSVASNYSGIHKFRLPGPAFQPPDKQSVLPPKFFVMSKLRFTFINFEENQLFPKTVSISLQTWSLTCILQHTKLRPDSLLQARSFGFGYKYNNFIKFLNHAKYPLVVKIKSPIHDTKGKKIFKILQNEKEN